MNETAISWTANNCITVFLMVLLGSTLVATAVALFARMRQKGGE